MKKNKSGVPGAKHKDYWTFCLALAGGLIIAGQVPNAAGQPKRDHKPESSTRASEDIAARYRILSNPTADPKGGRPCPPRADWRDSELCAEWKTADASAEAARWASVAGLFGGLSAFAVLAALYFAFQSYRISRDTAKRQLRAYLGIKRSVLHGIDSDGSVRVEIEFINSGQTPARNAFVVGGMGLASFPLVEEFRFNDLADHVRNSQSVGPGVSFGKIEKGEIPSERRERLKNGKEILYVYGEIHYIDVFGAEHIERYRLFCGGSHPNSFTLKDGVLLGHFSPADEGNDGD